MQITSSTEAIDFYFSSHDQSNDSKDGKKKGKLHVKSRNTPGIRAHHNALEQKRRGVIRGCFETLRKSVPTLDSGKKLSRSGILRETAKYIRATKEKIVGYQVDIEEMRLQNQLLSNELERLETLPSKNSPLRRGFGAITHTMKSDEEIQEKQRFDKPQMEMVQLDKTKTGTMFFDSFMESHYQNSSSSTDIFSERNFPTEMQWFDSLSFQQEKEICNQHSDDEDFLIDIESGFEQGQVFKVFM